MKALLRLPLDLFLWLAYLCLHVPLYVLGIPICYFLARAGSYETTDSPYFKDKADKPLRVLAWKSRSVQFIYGNWEDGIGGPDWFDARIPDPFSWKEVFLWSAWRNPTNNLRFVPILHPVPDPKRIRYTGNSLDPHADLLLHRSKVISRRTPIWCYSWQGVFAGFWIIVPISATRHFRFRIGWKVLPRDAVRGVVDDYRQHFYPYGLQLTPWRMG